MLADIGAIQSMLCGRGHCQVSGPLFGEDSIMLRIAILSMLLLTAPAWAMDTGKRHSGPNGASQGGWNQESRGGRVQGCTEDEPLGNVRAREAGGPSTSSTSTIGSWPLHVP